MEKKRPVIKIVDKVDVKLGNQKPKPNLDKVNVLPPPSPKPKKNK